MEESKNGKIINYPNGDVYEGEVENGVPNGCGRMTYSENEKTYNYYLGDWKNGKRDGRGTLYWRSGAYYEGEWENDNRTGTGTLVFADGKKLSGTWNNGKMYNNTNTEKTDSALPTVYTVFAILCFIGAVIGGIVAGIESSAVLIPVCFAGGFVAGMLWYGIAEILKLLYDIRKKTNLIIENAKKEKDN